MTAQRATGFEADIPPAGDLSRLLEGIEEVHDRFRGADGLDEQIREARRFLAGDASPDEYAEILQTLSRLCLRYQQPQLLDAAGLPRPVYNLYATFTDNAPGPWGQVPLRQVQVRPSGTLLGLPIGAPIGVPASALTSNPNWIDFYASRGFNVLTFKTVRSVATHAYSAPNWLFAHDGDVILDPHAPLPPATADLNEFPKDLTRFSTVNSFGVPSRPAAEWQDEVRESVALLRPGQVLLVSVISSPDMSGRGLVDDFVHTALLAQDAGAMAVELNLSCPNTAAGGAIKDSMLFHDADASAQVARAVRDVLEPGTKLVAKLGYLPPKAAEAAAVNLAPHVDGIAGINTVQVAVQGYYDPGSPFRGHRDDEPGERRLAGLSGVAIQRHALEFVDSLARARSRHGLSFDILGMGGVMIAEDAARLLSAGAQAVQSATAAMVNPRLAAEFLERGPARRWAAGSVVQTETLPEVDVDPVVLGLLRRFGSLSLLDLQGMTTLTAPQISASLDRLRVNEAVQQGTPGGRVRPAARRHTLRGRVRLSGRS